MRILFVSIGLGQYYCLKPVEDELRNRGYMTHSICAWSGGVIDSMTLKSIYDYNLFDAVICSGGNSLRNKFKRENISVKTWITMFHGCSAKSPLDSWVLNKDRDVLIVPGKLWYSYWLSLNGDIDRNKPKVVIGGFPKSDFLIRNKENTDFFKKLIRLKYNIDNDFPIILYAPTFSVGKDSLNHGTLYQLSNIYKIFNIEKLNLIVATHPGDMTGHVLNENIDNKRYKGIKYCLDFNKNEVILGSDIIISDSSSISFESSLIEKPVIQYIPENNIKILRTFCQLDKEEMILGPVILAPHDNNKLLTAIYELLENPKKYSEKQKYWSNLLNSGCDGNSTKRCTDIIINTLHNKENDK